MPNGYTAVASSEKVVMSAGVRRGASIYERNKPIKLLTTRGRAAELKSKNRDLNSNNRSSRA